MNPTPKKGVRDRMIDEIKAEISRQSAPEGATDDLLDQLTKAVVDAQLGLKNGRFPDEKRAAQSIVTKLSQLVS
ncbi:hypothetical protein GCM10027341_00570 [Spirosoma knui]